MLPETSGVVCYVLYECWVCTCVCIYDWWQRSHLQKTIEQCVFHVLDVTLAGWHRPVPDEMLPAEYRRKEHSHWYDPRQTNHHCYLPLCPPLAIASIDNQNKTRKNQHIPNNTYIVAYCLLLNTCVDRYVDTICRPVFYLHPLWCSPLTFEDTPGNTLPAPPLAGHHLIIHCYNLYITKRLFNACQIQTNFVFLEWLLRSYVAPNFNPDPAGGAYSAPPDPLAGGEGLAAPQEPHPALGPSGFWPSEASPPPCDSHPLMLIICPIAIA